MKLDAAKLKRFELRAEISNFPRIIRTKFAHFPKRPSSAPSRFSSLSGTFKVLYAGEDFATAFAAATVRDRFVGRIRRFIGLSTLQDRCVTLISTIVPLRLLDVRGAAAYELGIDTDATRSREHTPGQIFSEALHVRTDYDGLIYDSRLTTTACLATYERALGAVEASSSKLLMTHAELAPELERLGIVVRRGR